MILAKSLFVSPDLKDFIPLAEESGDVQIADLATAKAQIHIVFCWSHLTEQQMVTAASGMA